MVLLPDHLHALWELPAGDDRYPMRWKVIKRDFTIRWLAAGGREQPRDWPASTFHRYVASGHYDINWGAGYVEPALPGDAGEWI